MPANEWDASCGPKIAPHEVEPNGEEGERSEERRKGMNRLRRPDPVARAGLGEASQRRRSGSHVSL
jgi:hypothetical protein